MTYCPMGMSRWTRLLLKTSNSSIQIDRLEARLVPPAGFAFGATTWPRNKAGLELGSCSAGSALAWAEMGGSGLPHM